MSYFYADGVDRAGNRLLTSYKKEDQAKRYRAGAKISSGEKFLTIQPDGTAKLSTEDNGLLVRTLMVSANSEAEEMQGNFVVWARINGEWQETQFRYTTYAKANAAVKSALINLFPACAVIEGDAGPKPVAAAPVSTDEEAAF
jgi:hypothetical protein